jgi:hypothetical protein
MGGKTTFNSQGLVGAVETVEEATMTGMLPSHITAAVLALRMWSAWHWHSTIKHLKGGSIYIYKYIAFYILHLLSRCKNHSQQDDTTPDDSTPH